MLQNRIKEIIITFLTATSLWTSPTHAHAISDNFDFSAEAAVTNRNVWRGLRLSSNAVFQPSMGLSTHGMTLSLWGNLETTGMQSNCFTEVNFTADYTYGFDCVDLSGGVIFYDYPEPLNIWMDEYISSRYKRPSTTEAYLSVLVHSFLSPKIVVYRDLGEYCGWYINTAISHTYENIQLDDDKLINIDISASIGWGSEDHNYGTYRDHNSGFTDFFLGVDFPMIFGSHLVFTPSFGMSTLLCESIRDAQGYRTTYLTGMSASWTF